MLKTRITYGLTYTAIEQNTDNSKEVFSLLQLIKKRKELIIKDRSIFSDFNKLLSSFKNQQHIFLIINNDQVLSKEITFTDDSSERIVKKAFPNIVLKDFYYEVYSTDTTSFVCVCRKQYIDTLINSYKEHQVSVVGFSLGNLAIQNLLSFVDNKEIQTSNSKLKIEDNQLKGIEKTIDNPVFTYTINDLEVTNRELLPLGGVLTYYLQKNNQLGLSKKTKELRDNYFQKQLFSLGLKTGLFFLFLALLLNFLFFNYYHTQNNGLIAEVQLNESYKSQLVKLQAQIDQKEKVIANLNSVSQSKVSLYLDELVMLIPNSITLTDIKYQPLTTRIEKDKQIVISKNQLQVKGIVNNNEDFTTFISSLKKKEWVDNVIIIQFGKEKKTTSFEILIHTNHE
ncbi:hypothetical protein H0I31_02190 [Tenacibaculum sp. AHE15PA]|uniref:PilN domain-containing protein n=1 Tax=unclassified Tenacibaculum TaxID=2635139 RepID=UPI001C4EC0FF|nr:MULTISPECIES: PilN domain-containing protein [unclassified Tenacibaculum]QXP72532.1 hypothetical protein H0I30_07445 [Tenacibaculum sp. AHE14PA]QXP76447.1 hypothetical protein H0I31_02190 [Tenacibaculum sp. AHE15PA]